MPYRLQEDLPAELETLIPPRPRLEEITSRGHRLRMHGRLRAGGIVVSLLLAAAWVLPSLERERGDELSATTDSRTVRLSFEFGGEARPLTLDPLRGRACTSLKRSTTAASVNELSSGMTLFRLTRTGSGADPRFCSARVSTRLLTAIGKAPIGFMLLIDHGGVSEVVPLRHISSRDIATAPEPSSREIARAELTFRSLASAASSADASPFADEGFSVLSHSEEEIWPMLEVNIPELYGSVELQVQSRASADRFEITYWILGSQAAAEEFIQSMGLHLHATPSLRDTFLLPGMNQPHICGTTDDQGNRCMILDRHVVVSIEHSSPDHGDEEVLRDAASRMLRVLGST